MPGIVGFAQQLGRTSSPSSVKPMLGTLSMDRHQVDQYINQNGTVAISQTAFDIHPPPSPYSDPSASVFLYGEVYHGLGDTASFYDNTAIKLIAEAYKECGTAFVNDISGEFLIIILDHIHCSLTLISDRYGRRPTYYSISDGHLLFSSEIKAILAHPTLDPVVDEEAIADFLSFGYILGDRTLLKNVGLLPAAGILKYNIKSGSIELSKYWDLREQLAPIEAPSATLLSTISETFRTAVERRLSPSETNWISLSGGMDSRAIAAVADAARYPIKAITSGLIGGYERKITAQIANATGCQHLFYELDEHQLTKSNEYIVELIKEAIGLTDGMRGTSSSAMTAFSARSRKAYGLRAVLTGHGGEIAKLDEAYGFAIRNPQDEQRIAKSPLDWAFTRMTRPNAPHINQPSLYQGTLARIFHEAPRSHLESIINSLNPDTPPAQIISFLFLNELSRKRAFYALMIHRAYTDIRLPFYDDDFLGLVVRAPLSLRSNYKIHGHIIRQYRPELINIVLSDSRSRPFAGGLETLFRRIPFKLGKKFGLFKRDFPEDFFAANTGTEFFRNILLDSVTLDRGYFNKQAVADLLSCYEKGQHSVYSLLHLLTIVELWHRDFLDTR